MTAKGLRGLVLAGLVGLATLFGPPLADSLVKEGKPPEWLTLKLAEFSSFLTSDVLIDFRVVLIFVLLFGGFALALSASVRHKRMAPYVSPFTHDEKTVLVAIGKMTRGRSALESKKVSELTGLSVESAQRALKKLDHLKITYSSYNRGGKALVELTPKGRGHFLKLAPFATLEIVPKC
jgi:hypothetical protein